MLATLPFSFNFVHPLAEWALLATGGWVLYPGIKAKKTRTGSPEQRKIRAQKFATPLPVGQHPVGCDDPRHPGWNSRDVSEQRQVVCRAALLVGLATTGMIAAAASLSADATWQFDRPQGPCGFEHGHDDAVSLASRHGMEIVNKIWTNR